MRTVAVFLSLVILAGGGWWLHHLGYNSGVAEGKQKLASVSAKIDKATSQCQASLDEAQRKEKEASSRAKRLSETLSSHSNDIQASLDAWMKKFEESQCSVAKQPLCPALRDY